MKTSLFIALALFLPVAKPASADDGPNYARIRTNSGKVYVNCRVYKIQPDGVIIEFENGGAKLLFSDLSPELRATLGYDPEKEAAYEKERAEKKRKEQEEREELAKSRAEKARVQVAAYEAEAARYQFMAMQGGFGGYAGGGGYPYLGGYTYYNAGYFPSSAFGVMGSTSGYYGYGDLLNSLYAYNGGIGSGSIGYGNGYDYGNRYGYGLRAYSVDPVTMRCVTLPVPCGSNWNGRHGWNGNAGWNGHGGWNGNGGWHGNSFHGHHAGSRAFRGTPPLNVIGRPVYHIPTPCRLPVATHAIGRFTPAIDNCARR